MGDDGELFVVTAERDTFDVREDSRSIVFEQHLDHGAANLDNVKEFQRRLGDKYGKTRIARLVFIDEQGD
ncbi:MAG: hypothetical protein AB2795_21055 [Candidatus Thiodiazotropha endolucinida]